MSIWLEPEPQNWYPLVDDALAEDIGMGDVTAGALPPDALVKWAIEAQADGVLCGVGIAEYVLGPFGNDPEECYVDVHKADGEWIHRGDVVISGLAPARKVMSHERTALNFVMHLSGVATLTAAFVQRVDGTGSKIVDTRKTLPLLRVLQKYAVRCGGGHNHRMGLFDGAMLKDNHIASVGSIKEAITTLRGYVSHMTKIEVECESLEQVDEAVANGADIVLLDNMDPFTMREAVKRHKGKVLFEASGGISLETVRAVAQTGVELISVGALTHSAPSMAFHLELE